MKTINLYLVCVTFLLSSTVAVSSPENCDFLVTVAEESIVETWSISQTTQVGSVFLKLVTEDGEVVYEADGFIIGRISRIDDSGPFPVTYLNHRMFLEDGSRIITKDDMALPDFYPEIEVPEGSIPVMEHITQVRGTRFFRGAYTDGIVAKGYFTPQLGGENYLELSGTICMD
jgi:hypothetical protein